VKQKQFAAIALAAWLAVVAWVGSMILAKPQAFSGNPSDTDGAAAAQIEQQIQRADRTRTALATLDSPERSVAGAQIVALAPTAAPAQNGGVDGTGVGEPGERVVSFIISGDSVASRALIDGRLVGRGARLGDGAIVRRIDSQSVRIEDANGVTQTLLLRLPNDPLKNSGVKP